MLSALLAGRRFRRDPLAYVLGLGEQGNVVRFRAGTSVFTLVNHPDLIRRVLVSEAEHYGEGKWTYRGRFVMRDCLITREGEPHRSRRAHLRSSFDRKHLLSFVPSIAARAEALERDWRAAFERGSKRIDARREMGKLAVTMAGDVLLGLDLTEEAEELFDATTVLLHHVPRLPIPKPDLLKARARVDRTATRVHQGRMYEALSEAGVSDRGIRDEVIAMMIASVDTTPTALAWTWMLLARYPEVERRVHEELDRNLGGATPSEDSIARLTYLNHVIDESLRLYPPVHFIDRRPLQDVELDGVAIRKDAWMLLSPLITQRDPRFFERPEEFDPDRWKADGADSRRTRLSFPFGAGPHSCIGEGLSRTEMLVTLAVLAQRWKLEPTTMSDELPSPQTRPLPTTLTPRR